MNELDIYTYGQDIIKKINFPEYNVKKNYYIFFRGIFDVYGTIYQKTIFESNLQIEICLNNIDIINKLIIQTEKVLNIKWKILLQNRLILTNDEAKKFLDIIYIDSDARYRNHKNYTYYLKWLKNDYNSIIVLKIKKTLNKAVFPVKNNTGYDVHIVKYHKKIGKNTFIYDTGIKINIDFGYKIKITSKCCIINYGFILNNYIIKKDESIKIILTKIDSTLKKFNLPFNGFNLIIEKIYFFELEENF